MTDQFCWIHTTFSIEAAWKKKVGEEVIYPGIENSKGKLEEKRVYHRYYQWVGFVLFVQALLFYVPRYLWRGAEGGRTKQLMLGLDMPIIEEKKKRENMEIIVEYLYKVSENLFIN